MHKLPVDLRKAVNSVQKVKALWEDITPLARSEWIYWVTSGKKSETRGYPYREGALKAKKRNAPALLLGRLSSSIKIIGI